jgi:hypothetical protein
MSHDKMNGEETVLFSLSVVRNGDILLEGGGDTCDYISSLYISLTRQSDLGNKSNKRQ